MKKAIPLAAFCSILLLCGCGDSTIDLSGLDRSYIGEDGQHFEAVVDGTNWWPQNRLFPPAPLYHLQYVGREGIIYFHYFQVRRDSDPWSELDINVDTLHGLGSFRLADSASGQYAKFVRVESQNNKDTTVYYLTDSLHTGVLTITSIDTVHWLLTGTVSLDAIAGQKVIHLRSGSFKM